MGYRVAMVGACPFPAPLGSQILLRDTAMALRDRGHEVHLVVYGYGVGAEPEGLLVHRCVGLPGVRKIASGPTVLKPVFDAALMSTLRRVVRRYQIELVHAHNYEGLLVALAAGKRPILYQAHNAMADELPYFLRPRPLARAFGRFLDRRFPRRADHILVPHHPLAAYLVACGCVPAKIWVLPPSCDAAAFPDRATAADPLPAVLYTGNLDPYQNLGFLVEVMRRVREARPNARLRVATPSRGALDEAEMVVTPDLDSLCHELAEDVVVVCPRVSWSGFPIKLLNAMAAARPVVACRSSAYLITPGHDGLIVDDNDVEGCCRAILRLLNDSELRGRLGSNARASIQARHDPRAYAAAIELLYDKLLGRARQGQNSPSNY